MQQLSLLLVFPLCKRNAAILLLSNVTLACIKFCSVRLITPGGTRS